MDAKSERLLSKPHILTRGIERNPDGKYGNEIDQTYYIFNGAPNQPLIILLHGGGWVTDQSSNFFFMGETLSKLGINFVLLKYRITDFENNVRYPTHLNDALNGILHVLKLDLKYKGVWLAGHSAGGFMISMIMLDLFTYYPHINEDDVQLLKKVQGLMLLASVLDISLLVKYNDGYKDAFIELCFGKDKDRWDNYSPQFIKFNNRNNGLDCFDKEFLLVHSNTDTLLPNDQGYNFLNKLMEQKFNKVHMVVDNFGDHNDMPRDINLITLLFNFLNNNKTKL
ncbi:alpha/beta-hydrolase [Neoconidiobolus thromboides FSU 785]|nr:alpha/beta-hydrolase [Neoconidiobolus thromboides FSU 785]